MTRRLAAVCLLLGWTVPAAAQAPSGDAGLDFFEKKVRPVLVEHCYGCHSVEAKKDKGKLLVDSKPGLLKGGESGPAVVPGRPADSWLIKAVRYTDPELKMPPKGRLPDEAVADLEKWVAMGAPDPRGDDVAGGTRYGPSVAEGRKFWAFQPPRKHQPPAVKDASWPRGPVDCFLLAKLEAAGLAPAPDADRATLLRRTTFALVGLPPTPAELDAFLNDQSPDAFAKVVDGLLASPHFGEVWGRHWLDVARYAESTGGGRSLLLKDAWRYRDYVIHAFNTDKPFDRFLTEQLTGDLLPWQSPEERRDNLTATGYLLLGPHNYERQDKLSLEMDIIDEILDTLGKSVLGMTIGCARCHDHKFDPIPTRDYYALAGIFKSTKFILHDNVSKWMSQPLPMSPVEELAGKKHDAAVAALKERIALAKAAEKKAGKDLGTLVKGAIDPRELPGIVIDDEQAKKVGSWKHSTYSGNFIGKGYLYDDRGFKDDKTLTFIPEIPKKGFYEVRLAYVPHENRATNVPVRIFHADGENTVVVDQRKVPPIDSRFVSLGTYRFEKGNQWFVMVLTEKANGHVVADAVQFLPEDAANPSPPTPLPSGERGERRRPIPLAGERGPRRSPLSPLGRGAGGEGLESQKLEAQLKQLVAAGPERPTAIGVAEADKMVEQHICVRGNLRNQGAVVPRGVLEVATSVGQDVKVPAAQSGRKQLAAWLTRPDHPLTARVFVNRVWHHLFGAGLVRTVDNFGATGETPSHPELLDYLAVRFVEEGWSVKRLVRELVLSRAYQMSSGAVPEQTAALKVDPENRLLWKMNRKRLDAEAIRDTMLLIAGRLDLTMGGPGVKKGLALERDHVFDDTRRSVYTPVFRNKLLELFEVFDFADPNVCMGRRNVSTVSTQALYLLNSPFVMDNAKAAAARLLALPGLDDAGRVEMAYRTAVGRLPTAKERQLVLAYVGQEPGGREAAWERVVQTLFGCIDFRYGN
jgi:hypothetical protein